MSLYVKEENAVTRLTVFKELSTDKYQYQFILGNLHVVGGSILTYTITNQDWLLLFTHSELQKIFGSAFDIEHLSVFTFNADSKAVTSHFYAPEVYESGNQNIYQYFYPTPVGNTKIRINYILTYYYA